MSRANAPLIVHVIHRFGVGGLENGVVNLINHMPEERYRHAIVCLQGYTDFRNRLTRENVAIHDMAKRDGHDPGVYWRLLRTFRQLQPAIVHTRNLSAMEAQTVAALAGIPGRVHGEHGRDTYDLHGQNRKYKLLRKTVRPFIGHYIAVSQDLQSWLVSSIGVKRSHISQIYNGVDSTRFRPAQTPRAQLGPPGFFNEDSIVIGSVGRMAAVKDYPNLTHAFVRLLQLEPTLRERLRLLIVGEGESRDTCLRLLNQHGAGQLAWLPGERSDIPELMAAMDIFVLPSLGEGISNTILEAMATGLPVIATRVGGNPELVQEGVTGRLVPPADSEALAQALLEYVHDAKRRHAHGRAAREIIDRQFSIPAMVQGYLSVYDRLPRREG
ncbi:sugar transferase [Methylobacillus sp. MM3]|uniref:TIGR03088 family PEP-CTERM/XrtA system glycosyltransferase n=1 Tax=Methylobacillus sp. MM3 TaxID=1848039 RepID=UPI0007E0EECD|nr:TIGR03088 family PEP-CTERM/XrtA system glycosyltransferase [Methylobacillus sp. MM3]OAJ69562.1 sugar transferase [Methylobacillus sp. MM3]